MARRDRPDHRCGEAARDQPHERPRLRLRAATDGRGGATSARHSRRAREAHLLRQVHHDRRSQRTVEEQSRNARTGANRLAATSA